MAEVYTSSVIGAPAERVWAAIRDFNGLPEWHPAIAESRIEGGAPADQVGCVRAFRLRDGGHIRERLLATLKLTPITDGGRSFAEWSAEFDCPPEREAELVAAIGQGVFQGGFDSLKSRFGG